MKTKEKREKIKNHILEILKSEYVEIQNFEQAKACILLGFDDYTKNHNKIKTAKNFSGFLSCVPFDFFIYPDEIEFFLSGLYQNKKKYSFIKSLEFYHNLIYQEIVK